MSDPTTEVRLIPVGPWIKLPTVRSCCLLSVWSMRVRGKSWFNWVTGVLSFKWRHSLHVHSQHVQSLLYFLGVSRNCSETRFLCLKHVTRSMTLVKTCSSSSSCSSAQIRAVDGIKCTALCSRYPLRRPCYSHRDLCCCTCRVQKSFTASSSFRRWCRPISTVPNACQLQQGIDYKCTARHIQETSVEFCDVVLCFSLGQEIWRISEGL